MSGPKRAWAALSKGPGIEGLQTATTARYAHLFDDAQRAAAELVRQHIEAARNSRPVEPEGAE